MDYHQELPKSNGCVSQLKVQNDVFVVKKNLKTMMSLNIVQMPL